MSDLQQNKWWKFDFHTHTPASNDFSGKDKSSELTPRNWLKGGMVANLDCVAITDHNTGDWINKLKEENNRLRSSQDKPDWYRDLTIFPGVEITVQESANRIHLLAIFDPEKGTNEISAALGACGITSSLGDEQVTSTNKSFVETINKIEEAGGLAIPAHVEKPKGLLENTQTQNPAIKESLEEVIVVECCDPTKFDNAAPELNNLLQRLAKVRGSDAHKLEDIGNNFSWIKMAKPSIESLRWAFINHKFNVKNQIKDPNSDPRIFFSKMSIRNMYHCGRDKAKPFEIHFHPHLNTIIGGRGSGKSTLLESIRIVSGKDKNLITEAPKIHEELKKFMKLFPDGVMLENTAIILELKRNEKQYRLVWKFDTNKPVLEEKTEKGDWSEIETGDLEQRFEINLFSQKQINALATNPRGLLELVDRSPEVDRANWDSKWKKNKNNFFQIRLRKRELQRQLNEEEQIQATLVDIESDLEQYEKSGHDQILQNYQIRTRQKNSLPDDDKILSDLSSDIRRFASSVELAEFPDHIFEEGELTNELKTIYAEFASEIDKIGKSLDRIADDIDDLISQNKEKINGTKWFETWKESDRAYQNLTSMNDQNDTQLNIFRYGELVQKRNQLQNRLKQLDNVQLELSLVEDQANESLETLKSLREELFNKRKAFIDKVIGESPYVRMDVSKFGDKELLEEDIRSILGIDKEFKTSIFDSDNNQGLLWELYSEEDEVLFGDKIDEIKASIHDIANGNNPDVHRKFYSRLNQLLNTKPEVFDHLDSWWPEDRLQVKFSRNASPFKFENLEKGSAGQKAAAILAFLLCHGEGPVVIDQPEDDLDNALIYDLIVTQIQSIKARRQLIIATHNPNIVVNGDSELVNILKFIKGQVRIPTHGGLEEQTVRSEICDIMEGGQIAFENRFNKIMQ